MLTKLPHKYAGSLYIVAARRVAEDNASAKWLPYSALLFAFVKDFVLNDTFIMLYLS